MPHQISATSEQDGLTLTVYSGDAQALLAFSVDEHLTPDLAGFAIRCFPPTGATFYLYNRLNFTTALTPAAPTPKWTPSYKAPFQKFRWAHYPSVDTPGNYTYEVTAMYFQGATKLKAGATTSATIHVGPFRSAKMEMGFTRGYLASQAYARKFKNKAIRPPHSNLLFDTKPFRKQYEWLGFHARKVLFDFLDECVKDPKITVDCFAYDLDEPDFVGILQKLGSRLRAVLEDSKEHVKPGAREVEARNLLVQSAGSRNILTGHFRRYAHDKVLIQKKNGKPVKVLTGSANFSVRGLYAQANSVLLFDEPKAAQLYADVFQEALTNMQNFGKSRAASQWFEIDKAGLPPLSVSFAPHKTASVSLARVAEEIQQADSSVLFAVMGLKGKGKVLARLRTIHADDSIFSYGVTQSLKGINLFKPDAKTGRLVPFAALDKKVPPPFDKEWRGGPGQVIHHKFVVVDFNDSQPVVFTGSSNLADEGEERNGDNLLAIFDRAITTAYAIEAIRLVDHYHFRSAVSKASNAEPLALQGPKGDNKGRKWWQPYYDPQKIKFRERLLFVR